MRVLLVEDDSAMAQSIETMLRSESYICDTTDMGEDGLEIGKLYDYDIIILDLMLPDIDGYEVLRRMRAAKIETPILILSGLSGLDEKIKGLGFGADDYLTKPFSFEELLARLRALTRRAKQEEASPTTQQTHLKAGALTMDTARRTVRYGAAPLDLRPKAFRLLELLLRHKGTVVTRSTIAERVWGSLHDVTANAIDVTISSLRQALQDADLTAEALARVYIETERGVGYRLDVTPSSAESPPARAPT